LQEKDIRALAKAACFEAETGYPVPRYMTQAQCEQVIRQALPKNEPAPESAKPVAKKSVAKKAPARKKSA
jgi:alcohol dehydrogenase